MFSTTAKKIASNTIYQLIGKLGTLSITLLLTVLITRVYGRVGYGEFNIMQSFPALFFIIVDFGLNAIATRELSSDWKKAEKYFGNIMAIRILLSSILILGSVFALFFFPYDSALRIGTQLSMLLVLTQALFATTNIIFQVKLRYDLSTIGLHSGYAVILVTSLLAVKFGWGVFWINFSYIVGGVVSFLVNLIFVRKLGVLVNFDFDWDLWKFLFIESIPLGLMFVFSQINFRSDSILLSVLPLPSNLGLDNTETVAIYGLPYKIFEVSLVLPTFFMNSVYPVFVRHMNESSLKLKKTFMNSMYALALGGLIVGIVGYIFSPFAVNVLGGAQFNLSIDALRILLAGMLIFYITQPLSWLIVTFRKNLYLENK
jgi:O-antigen/teichoic acid export membrane protein